MQTIKSNKLEAVMSGDEVEAMQNRQQRSMICKAETLRTATNGTRDVAPLQPSIPVSRPLARRREHLLDMEIAGARLRYSTVTNGTDFNT